MTGQQVTSLVHDLVEMAKAMEERPALKEQLAQLERARFVDGETIARLEIKLMERSDEISNLTATLRSVEAERDDAGFRQLEAEDKAVNAVSTLQGIRENANAAIAAIMGSAKTDMVFMSADERKAWEMYKAEQVAEAERRLAEASRPLSEAATGISTSPEPVVTEPITAAPLSAVASNGTISPGESAEHPTQPEPVTVIPSVSVEPVSTPQLGESATDPIEGLTVPIGIGTGSGASSSEPVEGTISLGQSAADPTVTLTGRPPVSNVFDKDTALGTQSAEPTLPPDPVYPAPQEAHSDPIPTSVAATSTVAGQLTDATHQTALGSVDAAMAGEREPLPIVQPTPGSEQEIVSSTSSAEQSLTVPTDTAPLAKPSEPKPPVVEDEGWPFGFSRASHVS